MPQRIGGVNWNPSHFSSPFTKEQNRCSDTIPSTQFLTKLPLLQHKNKLAIRLGQMQ